MGKPNLVIVQVRDDFGGCLGKPRLTQPPRKINVKNSLSGREDISFHTDKNRYYT